MRLGFHYHVPAVQEGNDIQMPGYQGRFVDALADHCAEVACFLHTPVGSESQQMDYTIQRPNVRLVDLGPHCSVPKRMLSVGRYVETVRKHAGSLDALLLRGPSPLLPALATAVHALPTGLLLVGDAEAGMSDLAQPFWRKLAIRGLWKWNRRGQDRAAKQALTFVNSRKLFDQLEGSIPNLIETRTTTLTAADVYFRDDTCVSRPYRLLYVGRMDRGKGLFEIIEAVAILKEQGEDVVFDMVGWPAEGDSILREIEDLARKQGLSGRVTFHGPKPVGPELFASYRQADVFVIASKTSEGFPRTIWEAMAHSLPVVATMVGSIPQFVGRAAELVRANDVPALAVGLRKVLLSSEKRRELIVAGRNLALDVTLEKQVGQMMEALQRWVAGRK